jgi:hypothetical protein
MIPHLIGKLYAVGAIVRDAILLHKVRFLIQIIRHIITEHVHPITVLMMDVAVVVVGIVVVVVVVETIT